MAPLFKLVDKLLLHKKNKQNSFGQSTDSHRRSKRNLLSKPVFTKLFLAGVFFDQVMRVFIKITLPSLVKKEIIVCDRYLLDTLVTDIALSCGLNEKETTRLLQQWIRLFPKVDVSFFVHVPPEVAYQRKQDVHSLNVLKELSRNYMHAAKKTGVTILDGTKDEIQLKNIVIENLKSLGVQNLS
jgi:dTMP kinase